MSRIYGVDVSKFQNTTAPAGVSWATIAQASKFAIVRATYGTSKDASAPAHIKNARSARLQVGLYHFFRSTQPVGEQLDAFCAQAITCGVGMGDIAPAIDVEDDLTAKLDPSWEPSISAFVDGLLTEFGEAMVYITQRDFGRLGKPAWILDRPLWVAHYVNAEKPATPGNKPYAIWQRTVGPYNPGGPGGAIKPMLLDQNVADGPLPLAKTNPTDTIAPIAPEAPATQPALVVMRLEEQARNDARWDDLTANLYAGLDLTHRDDDEPTEPNT
ncbi:MAG TPA: glycoside hydrolase family 25 protein [Polyangiaceae bacterium]|nr:glycoside hydrolase family 25 protein [Polyangiaceae bacterium]